MKKILIAALIVATFMSCSKSQHEAPKHETAVYYFTVTVVNNDGTIDEDPLVAILKD